MWVLTSIMFLRCLLQSGRTVGKKREAGSVCRGNRRRAERFFMAPQRHDCVFNEGLQSYPPPCAFVPV